MRHCRSNPAGPASLPAGIQNRYVFRNSDGAAASWNAAASAR